MQALALESPEQLASINDSQGVSLIFKHSTRCPISSMALNRIQSSPDLSNALPQFYVLDLIAHRDLSAQVASLFNVHHESPQILLISEGECILDASHMDIRPSEILEILSKR